MTERCFPCESPSLLFPPSAMVPSTFRVSRVPLDTLPGTCDAFHLNRLPARESRRRKSSPSRAEAETLAAVEIPVVVLLRIQVVLQTPGVPLLALHPAALPSLQIPAALRNPLGHLPETQGTPQEGPVLLPRPLDHSILPVNLSPQVYLSQVQLKELVVQPLLHPRRQVHWYPTLLKDRLVGVHPRSKKRCLCRGRW